VITTLYFILFCLYLWACVLSSVSLSVCGDSFVFEAFLSYQYTLRGSYELGLICRIGYALKCVFWYGEFLPFDRLTVAVSVLCYFESALNGFVNYFWLSFATRTLLLINCYTPTRSVTHSRSHPANSWGPHLRVQDSCRREAAFYFLEVLSLDSWVTRILLANRLIVFEQ